jgi:hypothetical protein
MRYRYEADDSGDSTCREKLRFLEMHKIGLEKVLCICAPARATGCWAAQKQGVAINPRGQDSRAGVVADTEGNRTVSLALSGRQQQKLFPNGNIIVAYINRMKRERA